MQGDLFRIADLQDEISALKQGESSVTHFFTALKILWDELEVLRPSPVCSCDPVCSCGAFINLKQHRDADRIIRFLKGLNETYATVRSHIMLMDPLPSINRVFSLVIQQERQILVEHVLPDHISSVNLADASFNKAPAGARPQGSQPKSNTKKICSHCGKQGHIVDTCYKKHGYLLVIELVVLPGL